MPSLELRLRAPVCVASDVHLSPADPAGIDRFVRFLDGPAAAAPSLVIAGDLFEVWVTASQARDPAIRPVFDALRRRVAAGTFVGFVEGNRDFAASPELRAAGVTILPDVVVVVASGDRTGGAPRVESALRVTVCHGDTLCRKDVRYQAFRRIARARLVRHLLRTVPESWAGAGGRAARKGSTMETARKAHGDMGLDAASVADLLRATDADALVCGHVHWGRRHRLEVDGVERDIVVLGAWDAGDATFARIGAGRVEFVRWGG